jgi:hypothetical protein
MGEIVERVVRCECGYQYNGPENEAVAAAQAHAWDAHGMELSGEMARALVRSVSVNREAPRPSGLAE